MRSSYFIIQNQKVKEDGSDCSCYTSFAELEPELVADVQLVRILRLTSTLGAFEGTS